MREQPTASERTVEQIFQAASLAYDFARNDDSGLPVRALRAAVSRALEIQREQIAFAIEVADGRHCPECGGKAASVTHAPADARRRCGGGHEWTTSGYRSALVDAARIARDYGKEG